MTAHNGSWSLLKRFERWWWRMLVRNMQQRDAQTIHGCTNMGGPQSDGIGDHANYIHYGWPGNGHGEPVRDPKIAGDSASLTWIYAIPIWFSTLNQLPSTSISYQLVSPYCDRRWRPPQAPETKVMLNACCPLDAILLSMIGSHEKHDEFLSTSFFQSWPAINSRKGAHHRHSDSCWVHIQPWLTWYRCQPIPQGRSVRQRLLEAPAVHHMVVGQY